ncbi:MAG: hypothetical protein GX558_06565, partial [Clostridiales bacterium]|nr:hypothetical protein [Clostridiales bacterium]
LRVIDYKTGGISFNPAGVYFGLQLQLILYMAAALANEGGRPAGAFYFRVDDPLVPTFERDPDIVETERQRQARLSGLVVADADVVLAMSPDPERVLQLKFNADGSIRKGSPVLAEAQFLALARHALRTAARIAAEIRAGRTDIAPAQSAKKLSCAYCDYAAVCGIDGRIPGGEPRPIPAMKLDELMAWVEDE